ncbi:fibroblast growth factor 8 [Aplysia californica]|uniref:Fibroblast growth factor 8 n=1 Tax=Aplysia californica TaxID=6500 RepID=A0ABM0JH01_APLCA|nr:fibroblast growth factor 8 [Aplysia californica]
MDDSVVEEELAKAVALNLLLVMLLTSLLIYLFVALAAPYVDGASSEFLSSIDADLLSKIEDNQFVGGRPFVTNQKLVSACSERLVQMRSQKKIDARGDARSVLTDFLFESDPHGGGRVRIKARIFKKYLCFSRRGRLISRTNGRSLQCVFREEPHNGRIKLQSAANPRWYVGFNKRGRRLKGYSMRKRKRRQPCYEFTKLPKIRHWQHRLQNEFEGFTNPRNDR